MGVSWCARRVVALAVLAAVCAAKRHREPKDVLLSVDHLKEDLAALWGGDSTEELTFERVHNWHQTDLERKVDAHNNHDALASVVPNPVQMEVLGGEFSITHSTRVCFDPANEGNAGYLAGLLSLQSTKLEDCPATSAVRLQLITPNTTTTTTTTARLGPEGYTLDVTDHGVLVQANTQAGVFHGLQTLRQLLPVDIEAGMTPSNMGVAQVRVEDFPSYPWRGMHLDVARHFFNVADVKRFIDAMALHKMNRFHWHLTDDQGWRLPIEKYPKLTDVGGWRQGNGAAKYGGAYTKQDVLDVIAYAQARFITVIPEVEMPGHVQAAVAAYPQLSCNHHQRDLEVWTEWGVSDQALCVCEPRAIEFMEDVLDEVTRVFPGQYVHVGGDECKKDQWRSCAACGRLMEAEGLESYEALQAWFTTKISHFLEKRSKRLAGWDEILEGGLADGATVMAWRGDNEALKAIARDLDTVSCPMEHCYFDRKYSPGDGLGRLGVMGLDATYHFEPASFHIADPHRSHIIGSQGNVWTEGTESIRDVEYLTHPRMSALSEVLWSPRSRRHWPAYTSRLQNLQARYDALGINYKPHAAVQSGGHALDLERTVQNMLHASRGHIHRSKAWNARMFAADGSPV